MPGYGAISLIVLAALAVLLVLHFLRAVARGGVDRPPPRRLGLLGGLVYLVLLGAVATLAVTSIYPILVDGHMLKWWLWVHLTAAGGFVTALGLVVVLWADGARFNAREDERPAFSSLTCISFWIIAVAGLITVATMLANMFAVFGTQEIELFIAVHRYSGLAVVVGAVIHLYAVITAKLGLA